jgi:hypothetical protein
MRKRYIFKCVACGLLAPSNRSDAVTCSPKCRVWLHRHPEQLAQLKAACDGLEVSVAMTLQVAAVDLLRPDLAQAIRDGKLKLDDTRADVWAAFWRVVDAQIEAQMQEEAA